MTLLWFAGPQLYLLNFHNDLCVHSFEIQILSYFWSSYHQQKKKIEKTMDSAQSEMNIFFNTEYFPTLFIQYILTLDFSFIFIQIF